MPTPTNVSGLGYSWGFTSTPDITKGDLDGANNLSYTLGNTVSPLFFNMFRFCFEMKDLFHMKFFLYTVSVPCYLFSLVNATFYQLYLELIYCKRIAIHFYIFTSHLGLCCLTLHSISSYISLMSYHLFIYLILYCRLSILVCKL